MANKNIREFVKNNKGAAYLEFTFTFMMLMFVIAVCIGVFPIFIKIKTLNEYAGFTVRMIAMEGGITDKVKEGMKKYRETAGITGAREDFSECEFYRGTDIQLNALVAVKVTDEYSVKIINIPFSVPISAKALSRSEVYHK